MNYLKEKRSKRIMVLLISVIMVIMQVVPVFSATTNGKKVVKVACGINDALYLDEDGNAAGYCAPFLQQLAWNNNWKLEFVEGSWNDSVNNLYNGKVDLLLPTQMTDERLSTMGFSSYICGYQKIGLYAKNDAKIYYNDYKAFNGKKVGISENTSNQEELDVFSKEHGFTYETVDMNTAEEKIKALESGEVDLVSFSTLNKVSNGKLVAVINSLPFYICTRIDDKTLLKDLNKGIGQILVDNPDIATDMYNKVLSGDNVVSLTREENEKVEKKEIVKVALFNDTLPLSGVDKKGNPIGIYVDLLNELEKISGIKFEYLMVKRQENVYDYIEAGKADLTIGSSRLPYATKDPHKFLISNTIMDYTTVAITEPDFQFNKDENPIFAITKNRSYLESTLENEFPKCEIKQYDSSKDCLIAVQNGEADVTMMNTWEYNYHTKNQRFANMTEWENMRSVSDLVLGTSVNADLETLSILEKAISQISSSKTDEIVTTNLNMSYSSYDSSDSMYTLKRLLPIYGCIAAVLVVLFAGYILMKKRNEKALMQKNEELHYANEAKSAFLSRMSHELRTPLNAMSGYADLMRDSISSGEMNQDDLMENLDNTGRAAKYLMSIIDDILDIQSIERGKTTVVKEPCDLEQYIKNVVDIISQEADQKNIQFEEIGFTNSSNFYKLDGVRLQQVLLNILSNAVKFTPEGGKIKLTEESIIEDDDIVTLKFVISDTGVGMSREFVENSLFNKFAQENEGITSPYEGCGLGMAISKQLIELMGGEISCVSELGKGSTFTFTVETEFVQPRQRKRRVNRQRFDLKNAKILVCEDNPLNQDMEKRVLERMNCVVEIAEDGVAGVSKFKASDEGYFDVILMDIRMPNMDGIQATKKIRGLHREDAKTVPILAVSANAFEEDVQLSLDVGMNEHLSKPIDARILYDRISYYCKIANEGEE